MCSSRLNLLRAHLLLAKHFNPHLNLSVSFLSQSSLGMCAMRMNAHIILCAAVRGGVRVWHIYGLSAWVIVLSVLLALACLSSVLPVSTARFNFSAFPAFEEDKFTWCVFKQWPRYEPEDEQEKKSRCMSGPCFWNPRKINWKKKFWVFTWKKRRSACVEITVFLRITGAFFFSQWWY